MSCLELLIAASAVMAAVWYAYWRGHARQYEQSGYIPPPTSWAAELLFYVFSRALTWLAIGKIEQMQGRLVRQADSSYKFGTVLAGAAECLDGRTIFIANHQFLTDSSILRQACGRHLRLLVSAAELTELPAKAGFLAVHLRRLFAAGSAATGVISVGFKNKDDGQKAQASCIAALAAHYFRLPKLLTVWLFASALLLFVLAALSGAQLAAIVALAFAALLACLPGSEPALGIFPEGLLLPDNPELSEHFRPGAFRIARAVSAQNEQAVKIVPVAIFYKRHLHNAGRIRRFLAGASLLKFRSRRNPIWMPEFKVNLNELSCEEHQVLEARRQLLLDQYNNSEIPLYGAIVVRGDPVAPGDLPEDPIEAMQDLRNRVAALYAAAREAMN